MKKLFTIFASILLASSVFAQSPEKMSYQAVIRDASDNLISSSSVGMQISILQGSASGTAFYTETQTPTTNANGLVSIEIGGDEATVVLGDFSAIDWANGTYFIKIETDPTGGTNYTIIGTSQLLSVPYAMHAKTADTIIGMITELDPVFTSSQANNITATDITNLSNLSGINTGDEDLTPYVKTTDLSALTISGSYTDLINTPNLWDSTYTSIKNTPDLTPYATKDMAGGKITNLADPTADQDAATKAYVDILKARIYILELKVKLVTGTSVDHLLGNGISMPDLIMAGVTVPEFIAAGVTSASDYIGLKYQGGIIFYVNTTNGTGLVCALSDQSEGIQWYNGSNTTTGATGTAINTGQSNTNKIITNQGAGSYAAKLCDNYFNGIYYDWYLPSKDELNQLYLNKTAVGGVVNTYYWSSTETSNENALLQSFVSGNQGGGVKSIARSVRAVHAF